MGRIISKILDYLFPPKCVFCGKILDDPGDGWCDKCIESLPYTDDFGKQSGEFFDFCISPLYYTGVVRRSILNYKFRGASQYADVYGVFLVDCIRGCPDVQFDIISWVPLSVKHERKRGYDQAKILAEATACGFDDIITETLKKPRDVQAQSELGDKTERSANISGAYEAVNLDFIAGKRVLLIDDVVTTGSTLDECAKVLLASGATGVVCVTLARSE